MLLPDSKTELVRRGNKVVYDLGDKIVKVFNETKPVSDVFNEALNLARINECGIRSPKALEVSQLENANGWALVTEKVPGTTLADKMTAEPQRFGEYLEMFVDLQIEIHGYTSPLLNRQRDKFARMIDSLDQLNATTRYNLQERLDGMTKEFKVCHGDFNPPTSSSETTASFTSATGHMPPRAPLLPTLPPPTCSLPSTARTRPRPTWSSTATAPTCPCRSCVSGRASSPLPSSLVSAT